MHQHLGVGLGAEHVPALAEGGAQRPGVLDDAVVHQRERAAAIGVGVRVDRGRRAVCGPAGVGDGGVTGRQSRPQLALQHGDFPRGLEDLDPPVVHHREPRGIVTAVLEPLQPVEHQPRRGAVSCVAYDAAHKRRPSSISLSASDTVGASAISRMIGSVPDGRTCNQRSGHASRRPSCVSTAASAKARRSPAYTAPSCGPRGTFALTIAYRGAPATISLTVFPSRASSASTSAAASGASRPACSAGYITPPFPSPPMGALSSMILRATCASPTGARTTLAPYARAASSTTRDVERLQTTGRRPDGRTARIANASV